MSKSIKGYKWEIIMTSVDYVFHKPQHTIPETEFYMISLLDKWYRYERTKVIHVY
jgi:hypothetical protein